jgi:hypothetical protein
MVDLPWSGQGKWFLPMTTIHAWILISAFGILAFVLSEVVMASFHRK